MSEILLSVKEYLLILIEPSIALLIGILTVLVTKNSNKYNAAWERLTKAYHPIFLAAEPYLFKKINIENAKIFIDKFLLIETDHSLYIYPSLRHRVYLLSKAILNKESLSAINEHWLIICEYISSDYDKLCKRAHVPLRSAAYRLNKSQFSSKLALCWGLFKLFVLPLILFVFMCALFLFIIGYLDSSLK